MHTIDINLQSSKLLILWLSFITLGGIFLIFTLKDNILIEFGIIILIMFYVKHLLVAYGLRKSPLSLVRLLFSDGKWRIFDQKESYTAELCGDSTVTALVSILRFKIEGQKRIRSCVIFKDSLSKEDYRRLMVVSRL